MQIYLSKRKSLHKKRVQLPQDWFGTQTWPPFHCFGTPIWPPWRHVKTLRLIGSVPHLGVVWTGIRKVAEEKWQGEEQTEKEVNIQEWELGCSGMMFKVCEQLDPVLFRFSSNYSQLLPCGHLAITDTPIIRTAATSLAKKKNTDVWLKKKKKKLRLLRLSLMRILTQGPYSVRYKGSWYLYGVQSQQRHSWK